MSDAHDLDRFVQAQDAGGTYEAALGELRRGRKTSHWMWFVFPQIAGLGTSAMSQRYALASLAEARSFLYHPVLGPRLLTCCRALLDLDTSDPDAVLGSIDAQKLRSSTTLFALADPDQPAFAELLDRFYGGRADPQTRRLLNL